MFWGCFSYYYKGPCHIYHAETAEEKLEYAQIIKMDNAMLQPQIWEEWKQLEAADAMKWMQKGRRKPERSATWEAYWKRYKKQREKGKGGIDFIRYIYKVLKPLLILFFHQIDEPGFLFQQDNAPSYANRWTTAELRIEGILLFEHIGNSPDMNAIESAWMPLRMNITRDWNRPHTIEWTERAWKAEWEALPQDIIRGWVHRMIDINQLVIDHFGGNEFHG
jgi:hypothetical protein